jgi:hypothetical protein
MISTIAHVASLSVAELEAEGGPLFQQHFDEIRSGDTYQVDPDWKQYRALENLGMLLAFGARDGLTKGAPLIGYLLAIFVERHLHYQLSYAQVDVAFVSSSHRGSSAMSNMSTLLRESARALGASELIWHAAPDSAMQTIAEKSRRFRLRDHNYSESI